ncbi:MAG: DNA-binding GntR family transcriptional regulator [Paracoccaceae bacterium]|jgi:DNA-binding GntR family transcriptional regulator
MTSESNTVIRRFASDPDEQVIVDRIYSAVMEQRLAPKTKLSESQLCESFGVGRMRVRRALLLLASQGIVDLQANRGAFIACPNAKEANDVFEARKLIEPGLISKVASDIGKDDLAHLKERQDRAERDHPPFRRVSCQTGSSQRKRGSDPYDW